MNTVQPIRDRETVKLIGEIARRESDRNYLLWVAGINLGLRISDLRTLTVGELRDSKHITRREQKTGKETRLLIPPILKREAREVLAGAQADDFVFESAKRSASGKSQPIGRKQCYRIINQICRRAGIGDAVGCHTMRKTFGYHHYKQFRDVQFLMQWFNHDKQEVTLRYIGEVQDNMDKSMRRFGLGG